MENLYYYYIVITSGVGDTEAEDVEDRNKHMYISNIPPVQMYFLFEEVAQVRGKECKRTDAVRLYFERNTMRRICGRIDYREGRRRENMAR